MNRNFRAAENTSAKAAARTLWLSTRELKAYPKPANPITSSVARPSQLRTSTRTPAKWGDMCPHSKGSVAVPLASPLNFFGISLDVDWIVFLLLRRRENLELELRGSIGLAGERRDS